MLQNLINLVKENAGTAIFSNPDIPADRKDEAVQVAGGSIFNGLQTALSNGGVKEVMNVFSGKTTDLMNNPITQQISGTFVQDMSSKLGLSSAQAGGIASGLLPSVMGQLVRKTNDPSDSSFDLQSMFNQFSGGKTSGMNISSILVKFKAGLDKDGDGDVDLQDLTAMFSGSGGMMDKIKSVFK